MVEDIDLDVDLEKIRVCSRVRHEPIQVDQEQPEQPGGEEQQGEEQAESEEQLSSEEELSDEEDKKKQRPIRKRQPPERYGSDPVQIGPQSSLGGKKSSLSPRARKRAQSCAKYNKERGQEVLRTEMRIKEAWLTAEEGSETDEGEK